MRELVRCWQHTRMIVLIALCAALYVSILLPFKIATIVPGITEIRPGAALPIVFSIFFGPAAAWGTAFGNTIGDLLGGTIGPGSLFGFVGNFLYGYAPYRIVRNYLKPDERLFSVKGWVVFLFAIVLASILCAFPIALGVDFLKIVPFTFLSNAILLNNLVVSIVLAPILIRTLEKRIQQLGLNYTQVLNSEDISRPLLRQIGPVIILALAVLIYAVFMIPSLGQSVGSFSENEKIMSLTFFILLILASLLLL
jgi:energy-coupling factor transport system substrate-specific component